MKLTICAFIDAYGWKLFQRHGLLDGELKQAGPLDTVLGYSSACDPTILTGLQPEQHGHFSFFYYQPEGSPLSSLRPLKFLPKRLSQSGRVRNLVSRVTARALGYTGYFQLYQVPFRHLDLLGYSEKRDLYLEGGINSGAPTFLDRFRERKVPFHISNWKRDEQTNLKSLKEEVARREIRFAYLYLAEMDGILHHQGTGSESVARKIEWYDQQLRSLLETCRRHYEEVELHLFSDHGMTDVHTTCNLAQRVETSGLKFGRDYVAVYDSTMARFWYLNPESRQIIRQALTQEELGGWVPPAQLKQWGCDFPGSFYGEDFFLMKPGVLICPSFMGAKPVLGMHGYAPDDPDSVALFASTKALKAPPRRLADLHDFILQEVA